MTLPLYEKMQVQVELLYANKGDRSDILKDKTNLHYLTLPVLLQYEIIDRLKVEAGPEAGYLLAAYSRDLSGQTSRKINSTKDFDIGIDAGIAYDLTEKLLLGLRYNAGLASIINKATFRDTSGNIVAENIKVQNRSLQLSVGYRLF